MKITLLSIVVVIFVTTTWALTQNKTDSFEQIGERWPELHTLLMGDPIAQPIGDNFEIMILERNIIGMKQMVAVVCRLAEKKTSDPAVLQRIAEFRELVYATDTLASTTQKIIWKF